MKIFVTGIGGLIGSTFAEQAASEGHCISGIDDDSRKTFFGKSASVSWRIEELKEKGIVVYSGNFRESLHLVAGTDAVVHCASQPSHDYSVSHVLEDSLTNYMGTVELLEAVRTQSPGAVFVFLSTNKVYGDRVNSLFYLNDKKRLFPVLEKESIGVADSGVSEEMSIDCSLHTPFGVSKTAADLMVQEYRRCFGLKTVCFRCGCMTGPKGSATELQGFLGYLVKCAASGSPYTIYGHGGLQVRDNLCASDVARAILLYIENPKQAVYNLGGGTVNSISVLEAIDYLVSKGCVFDVLHGKERLGDHKWFICDSGRFLTDYPEWTRKPVFEVINELLESERDRRRITF